MTDTKVQTSNLTGLTVVLYDLHGEKDVAVWPNNRAYADGTPFGVRDFIAKSEQHGANIIAAGTLVMTKERNMVLTDIDVYDKGLFTEKAKKDMLLQGIARSVKRGYLTEKVIKALISVTRKKVQAGAIDPTVLARRYGNSGAHVNC